MKKTHFNIKRAVFLSYCIIFSISSVSAQTLTALSCAPMAGDSLVFQKAGYASPGNAGAGQLWDFSQINHDGVPIVKKYFIPANVPSSTLNPSNGSNIAFISPPDFDSSLQDTNFLLADSSGIYGLGTGKRHFYASSLDTSLYNARDLFLKLPFQYTDSSFYEAIYTTGEPPYGTFNTSNTKLLADASGTLITPCGTYTNVLRIRRLRNETSVMMGSSGGSHTYYYNCLSYEWYTPGIHGAILSIYSCGSSSQWTDSKQHKWSIIYNDLAKTPLGPPTIYKVEYIDFTFQNPSKNELKILMDESDNSKFDLQITDLSGKKIFSARYIDKTHTIDVSSFSPGIYIVQLKKEDGFIGRKKLIIEP